MIFDPRYLLIMAPAIILMIWAQWRIKSAYSRGLRIPARLSGAAAARYILDQAGLQHVEVVETHGMLSDHYDPREKVLRLSHDVYHQKSATSVGIAAHEAGHALQDATQYAPLVIRNGAVPLAIYGSGFAEILLIGGLILSLFAGQIGLTLILLAALCLVGVAVFQVINLPVEFNASSRAKQILADYQIVDGEGSAAVADVLNAAAWTYVAATLQAILQAAYWLMIALGRRD
jgi:Zn-dependent membrane protease YugP